MADEKKLTEKQEAFCNEYLVDFNMTRAAKAAGYSEDTAGAIGWENLRKPEIQARVAELRQQLSKNFNITLERIAQEYARIGFFDIRKIYDDNNELKPMTEISDDEAAAMGGVKRSVTEFGEGNNTGIKTTVEVKIWDKKSALDSLCKLMGYNAPDKSDLNVSGAIQIQPITGMEFKDRG